MHFSRLLGTLMVAALPVLGSAQQLTVSAAVSLTSVFNELAPKFEALKPGVTLRFNFGPSGVLLQQVAHGAPVDVLASADQATVLHGIEQKLLDADTLHNFALNTLVVVLPAQGAADVKTLPDLTSASVRRIAIGKAATMPAGLYAKESLDTARLWSVLAPKFVFADNVRQVLDYVARGEADAGFVYRTDAANASGKVKIAFTAAGHTPVSYPAIVVSDSRQKALARDFIAFLTTSAAQDVLVKYGFGKP